MHPSLVVAALVLPLALAAPASSRLPGTFVRRQLNDTCGLSAVQQPPSTLTPPDAHNQLVLIALGRGTQNYTCADEASVPASIGAVANLFNASCDVAEATSLGAVSEDANAIGQHFFVDATTPEFDIIGLGNAQVKKVENAAAPQAGNIPWLKLDAKDQSTAVRNVYRLNTKGGVAPTTCAGQAPGSVVQVAYEAQYWVYASPDAMAARRRKRSLGLPLN
ncbi:hypothetical protein BU23DRAFT_550479 [Bimuria novae-zelandiae CBS 107.79]|uniref:Malate dehydrogenase n=1 Tax=Bimuria novae-zelandiae CBS 107.79 TaxID=1447943 RepID=A0A6A5VLS8_9PLEO|nr:hypothetical protein BU23DRAFT_550479 [Bimuria novae-zelandiae CBS 107.79]